MPVQLDLKSDLKSVGKVEVANHNEDRLSCLVVPISTSRDLHYVC